MEWNGMKGRMSTMSTEGRQKLMAIKAFHFCSWLIWLSFFVTIHHPLRHLLLPPEFYPRRYPDDMKKGLENDCSFLFLGSSFIFSLNPPWLLGWQRMIKWMTAFCSVYLFRVLRSSSIFVKTWEGESFCSLQLLLGTWDLCLPFRSSSRFSLGSSVLRTKTSRCCSERRGKGSLRLSHILEFGDLQKYHHPALILWYF